MAFVMKANQLLVAAILAGAIGAPIATLAEDKSVVQQMTPAAVQLPIEGELPSLGSATGWLNSPPLTAAGLRGKVVLIDFWTYSCINWIRTLPHVRAWAEKYKDQGLMVIGVHTPEFEFEKNVDNVRRAAKDMRVDYPIAIDSDYAIWRAFENQYWPALYFVDAKGHIRHHQFGEGEYEQSERIIQQLPAEAGIGGSGRELVAVDARGVEAAADWGSLKSPENYVGYQRTGNFASPGGAVLDKGRVYALSPTRTQRNKRLMLPGASLGRLHAKTAVIDQSTVYIGSVNLDPRSESTNTELGLFARCPELAKEVIRVIDISKLQSSYRLRFASDGQSLEWLAGDEQGEVVLSEEPELTPFMRLQSMLLAPFVPEQLL
jgi:thiol-disulfide isomerase/thioredoxin